MPRELIEAFSEIGIARWRRPLIEQLATPVNTQGELEGGRRIKCAYLHTRYANTNVCGLYHADIIGAITNGQQNRLLVLFDKFDHECLL